MFRFSFSEYLDKLVLLVAMVVFLLMGIYSIRSVKTLDTLSTQSSPMLSESKVDVEVTNAKAPLPETVAWSRPENQSRGEDWVFDAFTPPVLYYNPQSREFAVTRPDLSSAPERDPWKAFEIELVEVRQRPYRLQLVGYAEQNGNYVASFQFLKTKELILAKKGKLLVEAGVKVLSFEVKQMEVKQEGSMPVFEKVGVARLMDYENNQEVYLTNLETKLFSDLEATIRSKESGSTFVVQEGSQVELDDNAYVIGALSNNPQEAMVTKISMDGGKRLSKLLTPLSGDNLLNQGTQNDDAYSPFAIRPRAAESEPES
ncbi:MAG TPA: hypothetical protein DIV79_02585 [Opitutae bacterium]|nr:hypothetical protein [Opitutaceae bacterium]HCR28889.1 hypothetical protein [Opitutae bacterium]